MKKTNHSNDAFNRMLTIITVIMLACALTYVIVTLFNNYIDYRIDKFMIDNQVWYRLDECL